MSPLPWFDTILLFYIVLEVPFRPESFGGFEEGAFPVYFLSFYFDTFLGGNYFLT